MPSPPQIDQLVRLVFPKVPRDMVHVFSCGHVIPPKNLLAGTPELCCGSFHSL